MEITDLIKGEALEKLPLPVVFYSRDYSVVWSNKAYSDLTGVCLSDVKGKVCRNIFRCSEKCMGCPVEKVFQTGKPEKGKVNFFRKDNDHGYEAWFSASAFPVCDKQNHIYCAGVILSDLSPYEIQLSKYRDSRDALLRILEYSTDHDSKELLREFLDEAEILTGSEIGFYHFVDEEQKNLTLTTWSTNTLKCCKAEGEGTHYPVADAGIWVESIRKRKTVIHNDYKTAKGKKGLPPGHTPVLRELVVPVMRGNKIKAILGVGNKKSPYDDYDSSVIEQLAELAFETVVRKQTQEYNAKLEENFAHAGRMEAIGRLAGGVAHDFNNMLSVIIGHCELAMERADNDRELSDHLNEIKKAAERSADLSRQLLAFARKQTAVPKKLDINAVISDMIKMLKRLIGEEVCLNWKPSAAASIVEMDPMQIEQIVVNLCINARDSIDGAGSIYIETENLSFGKDYCNLNPEFNPGDFVLVTVTDTGRGISREEQKHIFEPFYTTKEKGKGTGLGLSTVYGIVRQNQGFIHLYSEPGKGSSFKIYLPVCKSAEIIPEKKTDEAIMMGNRETVLLVEDETMILRLGEKILTSLGYCVLASTSPADALEIAEKYKNLIKLLITDIIMPEMNGKELSDKIKEIIPDIKIIFMSGYTANVISRQGILEGGIEFIRKPFSRNEFAAKINRIISS